MTDPLATVHEENLKPEVDFWRGAATELAEATVAYLDCPSGDQLGAEGQTLRNLKALLLEGLKDALGTINDALRGGQATKPGGS